MLVLVIQLMQIQCFRKLYDIAKVLGIPMEGRLGDLRSFIKEMLAEEKGKGKQQEVSKSHKKSRTERGLEKLVSSINYDRQRGDKEIGVKLLEYEIAFLECSWNEFICEENCDERSVSFF